MTSPNRSSPTTRARPPNGPTSRGLMVGSSVRADIALASSVASISSLGRRFRDTNRPRFSGSPGDFLQTIKVSAMPVSAENDWSSARGAAMVSAVRPLYSCAISWRTFFQLAPCKAVNGRTRAMAPPCLTMRSASATNHDASPAYPCAQVSAAYFLANADISLCVSRSTLSPRNCFT